MSRKRKYRSTRIHNVIISTVFLRLAEGPVTVGMDIAKREIYVVIRDSEGNFLRPWKVRQPYEIPMLIELLRQVQERHGLVAGMESTGTYGEPVRQAFADAGLELHRVNGKWKSDCEEVFDGVASAHDGKDASVIAELLFWGKSNPWPHLERTEKDSKMAHLTSWLDSHQEILMHYQGKLESALARFWPEVLDLLKLRSFTLLRLLAEYGGPVGVHGDPEAAAKLKLWGNSKLSAEKIGLVCQTAETTLGVRMTEEDQRHVRQLAEEALRARRERKKVEKELKELGKEDPVVQAMAPAVGVVTAAVLKTTVGDPSNFYCGPAYRKAIGLNLKERSSGNHKGKLKITKRGSSVARRWLYFAALRQMQHAETKEWCDAKKKRDGGTGSRAAVAVMRKLALAIWAIVARGQTFDRARLFPGCPPAGTAV